MIVKVYNANLVTTQEENCKQTFQLEGLIDAVSVNYTTKGIVFIFTASSRYTSVNAITADEYDSVISKYDGTGILDFTTVGLEVNFVDLN